jgi:hypothetical protein
MEWHQAYYNNKKKTLNAVHIVCPLHPQNQKG